MDKKLFTSSLYNFYRRDGKSASIKPIWLDKRKPTPLQKTLDKLSKLSK